MKRRVSFLVMLILAVALVFTLSACGECEHKETATRQEVTVEGDCLTQQRYDEVTYCVNCDTEISRESKIGGYGDHTPAAAVLENLDLVDCTKGGTAEKVVYCSLPRCKKEISRQSTAVAATTAHSISTQLLFSEDHKNVEMIEYCSGCAYRISRSLTADERTANEATINAAKAAASHPKDAFKANACIYCKKINSTTTNLKFTLNPDGASYTLEGLSNPKGAVPQNLRIGYYNDKPVTRIAAEAFKGLTGIRYVSIGSCVQEVGVDAFAGCRLSNLIIYDLEAWAQIKFANPAANPLSVTEMFSINENIKVGANSTFTTDGIENITGTYTFAGLKASSVYISADIKTVGEGAFANCAALLYVHIDGAAAKTVGKDAFLNCKSIRIAYDNSADTNYLSVTANPAYYASAFVVDGNSLNGALLVIKDGTTKINSYAYSGLDITGVKIPASVTEIANGAFAGCTDLATIEFLGTPSSLIIGESAFKNCSAVKSVNLPQTTAQIGDNAFENCSVLATVVIGDSVTSIGAGAFKGCAALANVALPANLTVINSEIFANCSALATVTLGVNVEQICDNAFLNCVSLTKFDFTDKITSVGNGAFSGCASMTELKLNSGL
ncbi:MAG: leucine-rich repeat protein, partial [Clostridia bacterium]|nr:leucine-rich repeat protein [Clostridia bacterium]